MGEYFDYVNFDRKERFGAGLFAHTPRRSGFGHTLGSRAFDLLLMATTESHHEAELVGSWVGDRVGVVGDQIQSPDAFGIETSTDEEPGRTLSQVVYQEYRDIGSSVLVMLLRHDGPTRYVEEARENDTLFVALAELALVHEQADAEWLLDEFFEEWRTEYNERRGSTYVEVPPPG